MTVLVDRLVLRIRLHEHEGQLTRCARRSRSRTEVDEGEADVLLPTLATRRWLEEVVALRLLLRVSRTRCPARFAIVVLVAFTLLVLLLGGFPLPSFFLRSTSFRARTERIRVHEPDFVLPRQHPNHDKVAVDLFRVEVDPLTRVDPREGVDLGGREVIPTDEEVVDLVVR